MPDGGQLTIETSNTRVGEAQATKHDVVVGDYVLVAITDTGQGIPKAILDRIFEPFFTTKEVGKGTGLGLAQIFGFVKQSRGFMVVYSEIGVGTCFKLYFPAEDAPTERKDASASDAAIAFDGGNVLIVEDDASVREVTTTMVRELGFTVLTAADGPEALKIFAENPDIDLLMTDMILPNGMTGKDLSKEMLKRRPDLNVLFCSGYTGGALSRNGRLDPKDVLLPKPFDDKTLARRIKQALGDGASDSGGRPSADGRRMNR
jgi:CheY-like chemotaxis protein